jgi:hypothetical protein
MAVPGSLALSNHGNAGISQGLRCQKHFFVLTVLTAICHRLIGARDLIIDSVPILAWRRADPDAAFGHAPAQHPRPLLRGYRVHTLLCRGSGLPLFFLLSPANIHDAPFARPLLAWAVHLYRIRSRVIRLDAAYWGLRLITWIHEVLGAVAVIPWNPSGGRTAPVCLPPGPKQNWANAMHLNASLAATSSSFTYNALPSRAGPPWFGRSLSPPPLLSSSLWLLNRRDVPISFTRPNAF